MKVSACSVTNWWLPEFVTLQALTYVCRAPLLLCAFALRCLLFRHQIQIAAQRGERATGLFFHGGVEHAGDFGILGIA